MSEQYRLVFSAEVVEGQHPAVVKKRLAAVLKLDDERMDVLFSGKSVVVKKAADEKTAARYQEAFKKAGARLRVLPVDDDGDPLAAASKAPPAQPQQAASEPAAPTAADSGELNVLPTGADVLRDDERDQVAPVEVDTSHLSVQGATFAIDEPAEEVSGPNVDHITLAELGAELGGGSGAPEVVIDEVDVEFDLAEVGATIGQIDAETPPALDLEQVNFEVAEAGADMDTRQKKPPPPAPDTSHIELDDQQD